MDNTLKYQQIIIDLLKRYGNAKRRHAPNVKKQMVVDKENHHYILLSVGWEKQGFLYMVAFHLDIIEHKIWVQCNNTDIMLVDELVARGVAANDIVVAFQQPETIINGGNSV
jgi:hypothetical protein